MGRFYEKVARPVLFMQDPERAHEMTVLGLKIMHNSPFLCGLLHRLNRNSPNRPIELFGLKFPNAVGLAAGLDKNAQFWRASAAMGFGHVEVGTVTLKPQPGNPRPRLFRFPAEEALINRMGFNNEGAEAVAARLKSAGAHRFRPIPLGINIGKSKSADLSKTAEDYLASFHHLADYADYFAINVSSPNTPALRQLQGHKYLPGLLQAISQANLNRAQKLGLKPIPLLVKIAPDLNYEEIDSILSDVLELDYDGIIASNTTVERPGAFSRVNEPGGLSGKPLHHRAVQIIQYIHNATNGRLPIIGVGGVSDVESAGRMADAGASLVQIYSGLIFKGPYLPSQISRALAPRHENWV